MSKSYDIDHEAEHAKRMLPKLIATLNAIVEGDLIVTRGEDMSSIMAVLCEAQGV